MVLKCETHMQNKAEAVCHHCGRPLCAIIKLHERPLIPKFTIPVNMTLDKLCGYQINDEPFLAEDRKKYQESNHCERCLITFHPKYSNSLIFLQKRLSF